MKSVKIAFWGMLLICNRGGDGYLAESAIDDSQYLVDQGDAEKCKIESINFLPDITAYSESELKYPFPLESIFSYSEVCDISMSVEAPSRDGKPDSWLTFEQDQGDNTFTLKISPSPRNIGVHMLIVQATDLNSRSVDEDARAEVATQLFVFSPNKTSVSGSNPSTLSRVGVFITEYLKHYAAGFSYLLAGFYCVLVVSYCKKKNRSPQYHTIHLEEDMI